MKTKKRKRILSTICLALFTLVITIIPVQNVKAASIVRPSGDSNTNTAQSQLYYLNNANVIEYTILIPMTIQVTGTRSTDKFQIKIDTTEDFIIEPNASVQVTVDSTSAYLVNVSDQIPYTLVSASDVITTPITNSPLVSFTRAEDPPKDVFVYFDPDDADYAGRYGDTINFTITYVKASATSEEGEDGGVKYN
jgi:hypothetical protein